MYQRPRSWMLSVVLASTPAFGFGPEGHKIIATIATANLAPQAKAGIRALLGDQSLADVSTWADEIKSDPKYRWADKLHYANVEPGSKEFVLSRDCQGGKCVVGAILQYTHVLRDPKADQATKLEALRFLTHLVADVHQPLHVSYAHDKGGNDVKVFFFYQNTDLHTVWDSMLIRRAKRPWSAYADLLADRITKDQRQKWSIPLDPSLWATESYRLAISNAYPIPKDGQLGQEYFDRNLPVIEERLEMAGIRLAALLNSIFGDGNGLLTASAPATEQSPTGPFVGSKRSQVYHFPSCRDVKAIKQENLVSYEKAPEGKRLHQGCPR